MTSTVTLLTDRAVFEDSWRTALEAAALGATVASPDTLVEALPSSAAIVIPERNGQ